VERKEKGYLVFESYFNPSNEVHRLLGMPPSHNISDMPNMVHHAILSSLSTEIATATFLLHPNWKGLNANAYMQIIRNIQSIVLSKALFPRHQ